MALSSSLGFSARELREIERLVLIGVEDRNRNVRGVSDPLDEEERLANLISDPISPRLIPEIKTLSWRQTQVLAL